MTTTEKMIALMRRLKIEMNGAVSEAMESYSGAKGYGVNYGVSLPTIRDAVGELGYAGDHELAALLWKQDVRELKLAALFVEDPERVDPEQMERWSAGWSAPEQAEQSAMQLFWQAGQALEVAERWLSEEGEGGLRRLAAYYMIGKRAKDGARMKRLLEAGVFDGRTRENSAVYALREIYRHQESLREYVLEVLERVSPEVAGEVRWQLEYLSE